MKKLFVGLLFLFSASSAFATTVPGDLTNRWGAGFDLGMGIASGDAEALEAFYGGAVVTYGVKENWNLRLDLGYLSFDEEAHGIDYGSLGIVPMLFDLEWRNPFSFNDTLPAAWYLVGGIGALFMDLDESQVASDLVIVPTINNAFAARFGGGFDVFLADHWAWNFEGSYTYSSEDIKFQQPGTGQTKKKNLDFWHIGSGIRYYF